MMRKRQDPRLAALQLVERQLTGTIIECFFTVYNTFDFGRLEGVYRHALAVELSRHGLDARTEVPIEVMYRGVDVGLLLHFGLEPKFHRLVSPRIVRTREEQIPPLP